jgi:hypothetical protein
LLCLYYLVILRCSVSKELRPDLGREGLLYTLFPFLQAPFREKGEKSRGKCGGRGCLREWRARRTRAGVPSGDTGSPACGGCNCVRRVALRRTHRTRAGVPSGDTGSQPVVGATVCVASDAHTGHGQGCPCSQQAATHTQDTGRVAPRSAPRLIPCSLSQTGPAPL